jgi:hypothetical protein
MISEKSGTLIMDAVEHNLTLVYLGVANNFLNLKVGGHLLDAVKKNTKMQRMDIEYNNIPIKIMNSIKSYLAKNQ